MTLIPGGSKFNLAPDPELLRDRLVACDPWVAGDPTPLGKVADVIQRGFLHAGTRQAACQLLVGQFLTLDDTPCIALGLRTVRKRHRRRAFMLQSDPVLDLWRCLLQGALEIDAPHRVLITLVILEDYKIARAGLRIMLVGRNAVINQPARIGKLLDAGIELHAVAMPGYGDIGQMPIHGAGRQHKGAIDRSALVFMDRRHIAAPLSVYRWRG